MKCPGSVVIRTFDAVRQLRDAGVSFAGGFHSPMERDCLTFLLRGTAPTLICAARGLARPRLPSEWRRAAEEDRLTIVSHLPPKTGRTTKEQAIERNRLVTRLARALFVPHAAPVGKADALARSMLAAGRPDFVLDDESNAGLLDAGTSVYRPDAVLASLQS